MNHIGVEPGGTSHQGFLRPPILLKFRSSKWFIEIASFIATFTDGVLYSVVSINKLNPAFVLEFSFADYLEIVPLLPFTLVERLKVPPDMVQWWITLLFIVFGSSMVLGTLVAG